MFILSSLVLSYRRRSPPRWASRALLRDDVVCLKHSEDIRPAVIVEYASPFCGERLIQRLKHADFQVVISDARRHREARVAGLVYQAFVLGQDLQRVTSSHRPTPPQRYNLAALSLRAIRMPQTHPRALAQNPRRSRAGWRLAA